jgi:hypothetical protein
MLEDALAWQKSEPWATILAPGVMARGAVRGPLHELFSRMDSQVGATVESYGRPNDTVLQACRELGRQLASVLR